MTDIERELYHWGVKGMKWGRRRYQNPDGSLTPEGEKRYYNADGSLTRHGKGARNSGTLSYKVQSDHLKKLHDSKAKKADDPNVNYFSSNATKGRKYVKQLSKQMLDGKVTSFTEKANGQRATGKTKKGVVARDKDGNRITLGDYNKAQEYVRRYLGYRVTTGAW